MPPAGPAHQFQADRVAAVGQQHVGPEPLEHLPGQVEEPLALDAGWAISARLEARRHHRDTHAVELEVNHLRRPPRPSPARSPSRPAAPRCQRKIDRRLALVVEDAAAQTRQSQPRAGQELEHLAGRQRRAAGRVEIAVDRGEQQPAGASSASDSGTEPRCERRRFAASASAVAGAFRSEHGARQSRASSSRSPRSAARAARLRRVRCP